jgi:cellulose synthase/poly-beta-1,6-N-acetylglucosamine synthase-like glycosyltransferase
MSSYFNHSIAPSPVLPLIVFSTSPLRESSLNSIICHDFCYYHLHLRHLYILLEVYLIPAFKIFSFFHLNLSIVLYLLFPWSYPLLCHLRVVNSILRCVFDCYFLYPSHHSVLPCDYIMFVI